MNFINGWDGAPIYKHQIPCLIGGRVQLLQKLSQYTVQIGEN